MHILGHQGGAWLSTLSLSMAIYLVCPEFHCCFNLQIHKNHPETCRTRKTEVWH